MSYIATGSDALTKIGDIFKTGATVAYGIDAARQAAQTGVAPATGPVEEPFNWTPVLILGGLGLAAFLLLRK